LEEFVVPSNWVPQKKEEESTDNKQQGDENVNPIPVYVQAHQLFHNHEVDLEVDELKWKSRQVEELIKFLGVEMGYIIIPSESSQIWEKWRRHTRPI
jgi:hypothetical protein